MEPNEAIQPQVEEERYYGQEYAENTVTQPMTLGDRLREYYNPGDFVTVMNIDTQPIRYQWATEQGYETYSDYPGHKDTRQPNKPKVVTLQPGQMKLCSATEADLMITNLIKQMATRVTERKIRDGAYLPWQSTNWQDANLQKSLIERIFQGKQDVLGDANAGIREMQGDFPTPATTPTQSAPTEDILAELDKDQDNAKRRPGRPPKVEA